MTRGEADLASDTWVLHDRWAENQDSSQSSASWMELENDAKPEQLRVKNTCAVDASVPPRVLWLSGIQLRHNIWSDASTETYIPCMHPMHACHACIVCMHTMHAYILSMHIMHARMHTMHDYYACMHTMHVRYACILCMHACHACISCMHSMHA